MNHTSQGTAAGFAERAHDPLVDIPTDTEEFLRWGTTLDPDHPFKYELSNGMVSRMMIQVSRAHWRVTTNILRELLQKLDRARFEAGPAEFGVRTKVGVRYPDVIVDRASSRLEGLAWQRQPGGGGWPELPIELAGREGKIALGELTAWGEGNPRATRW